MTSFQATLLGILQGATEFLPVSSSGHLFLAQKILGLKGPELAFDILLHLGTLSAVLLFLRREVSEMLASLFRRNNRYHDGSWGRRDILLVIVTSIPTGIIGFVSLGAVETGVTFRGVGIRYLFLTVFLLASNLRFRQKEDPERIDVWEAFVIGILQGAAVFPGLSRSGSTISLALVLGVGASRSAKFSFLVSIPAILGAVVLHWREGVSVLPGLFPSALGFLLSFVVGYLCLMLVENLVTRGKFLRFAPYTFLLAVLSLYLHRIM